MAMVRRSYEIVTGEEIEQNKSRINISPFWRQVYIVSAAWNVGFLLGMAVGTNTVAIPQMLKESIEVTENMRSWLGSIFGFTSNFWFIVVITMINHYGVKKTYFMIYCASFVGSVVVYTSSSALQVLCGEAIESVLLTSMTNVSLMVLTEYVTAENRSLLFTIKSASFAWGIWLANVIGTFAHWKWIPVTSIFCSLYGFSILVWPESPYWLAGKGRIDECIQAFRWSRGINEDTEHELKQIIENQLNKQDENKNQHWLTIKYLKNSICVREFLMPMFVSIMLLVLSESNGKLACTIYAVELLQSMFSSKKSVYSMMLILDGIGVFGMYSGCYVAKKVNRRRFLFVCSFIGTICLFLLSIESFLVDYQILQNHNYIFVLSVFAIFSLAICVGPFVLISTLKGEITPINNRLVFCSMLTVINQVSIGLYMKSALFLFRLGTSVAFLTFGCLSSVAAIVLYIFLPETRGKTNLEISKEFERKPNDQTVAHDINPILSEKC